MKSDMEVKERLQITNHSVSDYEKEESEMANVPTNADVKSKEESESFYMNMLFSILDQETVKEMISNQRITQRKYEETNQMLTSFNDLSEERFMQLNEEFKNHTKTLIFLRKDLEIIFRRIRALKSKLSEKYPEAFEATAPVVAHLREKYLEEQERLSNFSQSEKIEQDASSQTNEQSNDQQEEQLV